MQAKYQRNGKIEFLRFVFCLIVMIFHGKNVMDDGEIRIMFSGRLGVEFFFLVSGYLMAVSLAKIHSQNTPVCVATETGHFLLKKLKSLYPMVVIAFVMTMFMSLYTDPLPFSDGFKKII